MRISVVLPYRNEAKFIAACLNSLVKQTERSFQLIAVNDGSTDSSQEIVASFADRFPEFLPLNSYGKGLIEALKIGLEHSRGDVIMRADADDIYHPMRFELQLGLLDSGVDVAGSLVRFFPRPNLMAGFATYEDWMNRLQTSTAMASEFYVDTPISHPSLAVRREVLDQVGGYRKCPWPEDFDLLLRLFQAGAMFGKVPHVLHFWREHPNRLCRTEIRYSQEAFIKCRCHYLARSLLARKKRIVLWGAGPIGKKTASHLLEEGISFEAFIDIDPKKINKRIRGRKVYSPTLLRKDRFFVLSCVGTRNARYLIRANLENMGYRERLDFIVAA
ncbi:MAG: glycosyltransferase [Planctomycetota bacterium]